MKCARTRRLLDRYLDGELRGKGEFQIIQHLESCPGCSAHLTDRKKLRLELSNLGRIEHPAHDLWDGVQARMNKKQTRWTSMPAPKYIFAAGAATMAVGIFLGLLLAGVISVRPAQRSVYLSEMDNMLLSRIYELEEDYQQLKSGTLTAAKTGNGALPEPVLSEIEIRLTELDARARSIIADLERYGGSADHYRIVFDHYRQKFDLLYYLRDASLYLTAPLPAPDAGLPAQPDVRPL